MLKVRVIPTLLWKDVGLVKGIGFDSWRRVGPILPAVKVYNLRQVDELVIVDITANTQDRGPDLDMVREVSCECFVPLTVGGGIRSVEDIRALLLAGADKVCINSACYDNPQIITQGAQRFGSQCIVVSIDAKREPSGGFACYSHSGKRATGLKLREWAQKVAELGAGEILITSIDLDGTMNGYDLEMIREVSDVVRIPVIASGGAGSSEHMVEALTRGKASAVAAASIFHFTQQTPLEAKQHLASRGIAVRDVNARRS